MLLILGIALFCIGYAFGGWLGAGLALLALFVIVTWADSHP